MGNKLNTHQLLKDYWNEDNYPEIAKFAADVAKKEPDPTIILNNVAVKYGVITKKVGMNKSSAPLNIFGRELIDPKAISQMYTAMKTVPAISGALMPDSHLGYALPIGGVIKMDNAISPSYIGYDISCMMFMSILDISKEEFLKNRNLFAGMLTETTHFGMDFGPGNLEHEVLDETNWQFSKRMKEKRDLAARQLGSSGGGNHFVNIMFGEFLESFGKYKMGDEFVALLSHSGSRGVGHRTATEFLKLAEKETARLYTKVPKDHRWLEFDSNLGEEYYQSMILMGDYALANHETIHRQFMELTGTEFEYQIYNRHNFAWYDPNNNSILHRKGATPAHKDQYGIIPGSSATNSYLVKGKGYTPSLDSASHGAGRLFSRTKAKEKLKDSDFDKRTKKLGIFHMGIGKDEYSDAYKDIEEVLSFQEDMITKVARMTPNVVIMGSYAADAD